ncbi:MAG TPA: hypothetical protein VN649_20340 [Ramlibacter sp.]|nr:hypothetical protein [Ramlibacter sp.]
MKATSSRRKLIVIILLALALVGAGMRSWAPDPSVLRDMGTLLLVLWLPVIGNIVAFAINRIRASRARSGSFEAGLAFTPHLLAELTPAATRAAAARSLAANERCCTLVLGSEGFTARLAVPVAHWLQSDQPQPIELEFLRPALAVTRFPAGATFRVVAGDAVAGQGRVIRRVP